MNLTKYISANIFSLLGNILFLMAIYLFFFLGKPNIPKFDFDEGIALGELISASLLPLLVLHFIEWLIRRRKPNLLPKIKRCKCKYFRYIYYFILSFGYFVGLVCLTLFLLIAIS